MSNKDVFSKLNLTHDAVAREVPSEGWKNVLTGIYKNREDYIVVIGYSYDYKGDLKKDKEELIYIACNDKIFYADDEAKKESFAKLINRTTHLYLISPKDHSNKELKNHRSEIKPERKIPGKGTVMVSWNEDLGKWVPEKDVPQELVDNSIKANGLVDYKGERYDADDPAVKDSYKIFYVVLSKNKHSDETPLQYDAETTEALKNQYYQLLRDYKKEKLVEIQKAYQDNFKYLQRMADGTGDSKDLKKLDDNLHLFRYVIDYLMDVDRIQDKTFTSAKEVRNAFFKVKKSIEDVS